MFAAPRNLSQRTTSFIASQCQGIHQMLLSRLITLIINVHPGIPDLGKKSDWMSIEFRKTYLCFDLPVMERSSAMAH